MQLIDQVRVVAEPYGVQETLCVCIYIYIYIYRLMWDIPYKHTLDCFIKNKMAPTFFYQKKKKTSVEGLHPQKAHLVLFTTTTTTTQKAFGIIFSQFFI